MLDGLNTNFYFLNNPWSDIHPGQYFVKMTVFYGYFSSIGVSVHVEESSRNGRMDMTVLFDNRIYIFEFKVVKQGDTTENTLQQALAQISEKGYTDKY